MESNNFITSEEYESTRNQTVSMDKIYNDISNEIADLYIRIMLVTIIGIGIGTVGVLTIYK
jgi:hypothetical protein